MTLFTKSEIAVSGSLIVRSTGTINIKSSNVMRSISGNLRKEGGSITCARTWTMNNGAIYTHATDGGVVIPGTWNTGSTCTITGTNLTLPTGMTQVFYNLIWNCTGQTGNLNHASAIQTVTNDFTIASTGTGT